MKTMAKFLWVGLTAFSLLAFSTGHSAAQQTAGPLAKQLVGTWILVSLVIERPDGSKFDAYGPNPKGTIVFDGTGRYINAVVRADRPKFDSGSRLEGTPEQNKAIVEGTNVSFGTYSVDEKERSLMLHVEAAMIPNSIGNSLKRMVTLNGDELTLSYPGSTGRGQATNVYRRAK
jgi:hypothetical protein